MIGLHTKLNAAGPLPATVVAASSNLSGGWTKLWAAVSGNMGGLLDLATMAGVGCVAYAVIKWVWGKFRGHASSGREVGWALGVGALLTMPNVIIPGALKFADWVINIATGAAGFN